MCTYTDLHEKISLFLQTHRPTFRQAGHAVLKTFPWLLLFALAYGQSPLYTSNQHTYFLHGFQAAKQGPLTRDWMTNTIDPFPVFSALVSFTLAHLPTGLFYIFYAVVLGAYAYAIVGIVEQTWSVKTPVERSLVWLIVFLLHAIAIAHGSLLLLQGNIQKIFTVGLASQKGLGSVFQPSVFSALLLVSINSFLKNHPKRAVLALGAAATLHSSYLLSAGILTIGYMSVYLQQGKKLRTGLIGLSSLALVLPTIVYAILAFYPTDPLTLSRAQFILINIRIPLHALYTSWLGASAFLRIGIMVLALFIVRKQRIFPIMFIAFLLSALLSVWQIATNNQALALLFPWRISSWLLPLASVLLFSRGLLWLLGHQAFAPFLQKKGHLFRFATAVICVILGGYGCYASWQEHQILRQSPDTSMMEFVRSNVRETDVYLIPPSLERFRLYAQAPVIVDFKTHPYKDTEVIEWYDRLQNTYRFYAAWNTSTLCELLPEFTAKYSLSHVVQSSPRGPSPCKNLVPIYQDQYYTVFSIHSTLKQ